MTDQLTAGPELDARIATEVMGWRFDERWGQIVPPEQKASPGEMFIPSGECRDGEMIYVPNLEAGVPGMRYMCGMHIILVPNYSTDIAAAWHILERLQPPARDDAWREFVHSLVGALHLSHMTAREAAFAICRAALQDLEVAHA